MTSPEYTAAVLRTLSDKFCVRSQSDINLLHGAIGASTEANEMLGNVKKYVFYGEPLDRANLIEELGDLYWYMEIVQNELGVTAELVKSLNIQKLKARYPDGFTSKDAINRDVKNELKDFDSV